jgi:hypothetical protein
MEGENAYDNIGGYISESGNWLIYREGRYHKTEFDEDPQFIRDGVWGVFSIDKNGEHSHYGDFPTLKLAKNYVDYWISANPQDYGKGGSINNYFTGELSFLNW